MRLIALSVLASVFFSINLAAQPAPSEATEKQIAAAKKTYAKFGAELSSRFFLGSNQLPVFVMSKETTDADLKGMPDLPFSFELSLNGCKQVTDAGIKELKNLKNLESLSLNETHVTDAGIKELKDLKNLKKMSLSQTKITDEGLNELKEFKSLTELILTKTSISDTGLKALKDIKNLETLYLNGTKVTRTGAKQLQAELPDCRIVTPYPRPALTWEYKVLKLEPADQDKWEKSLNDLGEEGWEVFSTTPTTAGPKATGTTIVVMLKRQKSGNAVGGQGGGSRGGKSRGGPAE